MNILTKQQMKGVARPFLTLSHRDYCGIDLSYRSLPGSDMSFLLLSGSKLYESNFVGSIFRCANLSYADLTGALLRGCDFRSANLGRAKLESADLEGAIFDTDTELPFEIETAVKLGMRLTKS